jgi:hypothetical protein
MAISDHSRIMTQISQTLYFKYNFIMNGFAHFIELFKSLVQVKVINIYRAIFREKSLAVSIKFIL